MLCRRSSSRAPSSRSGHRRRSGCRVPFRHPAAACRLTPNICPNSVSVQPLRIIQVVRRL